MRGTWLVVVGWFRRPVRRAYVVVLYLSLVVAVAVGYLVLQSWLHGAGVSACKRANAVRRESNARIGPQTQDAQNLALLADRLRRTRDLEEEVAHSQAAQIRANEPLVRKLFPQVNAAAIKASTDSQLALYRRLVHTYRVASAVDATIAAAESRVHFRPLTLADCGKVVP